MFTRSTRQIFYAIALAAMIVIPRAILIQRAHSESADDEFHLVRGLEFLHRDHGLVHRELNDPPLGEALAAIPLWLMGGTTHGKSEGTAIYDQANYSPETALMMVAVWKAILFLPLIAVVFVWCRQLYGQTSAWLATAVLLIEPTITGHLHLAALDVLATSAIVVGCFLGWRCFERPTTARLLSAAFGCGTAMLIKHTGILVPLIFVFYAFIWLEARLDGKAALLHSGGHSAPADEMKTVLAFFERGRKSSFTQFCKATGLNALLKGALLTVLAMWMLLAFDMSPDKSGPFPGGLYFQSVRDALGHIMQPNSAYLLGSIRPGGWWYYFPVVATYKVPIGIALVVVLGILSLFQRRWGWQEWGIVVPLVTYVVFLMSQSINIGWRHFLPAYVFLLMLASRCLAPGVTGRIAPWIIVALVAFSTTLRWHPDYVGYVTWPRKDAYLAISDSNLDWGQGLKQVRGWVDENREFIGGRAVYLRAFTVTKRGVQYYLGDRVHTLNPGDSPPRSGILILSPVCLSGISESNDEYAFLRSTPPRNLIGHTLRVYDLDHLER